MMYVKATVDAKLYRDGQVNEKAKIIVFLEPGMHFIEFNDGTGITGSYKSFIVHEKIDELLKSIELLEI